ncbi:MAG TPA: hypothetical protein VMT81_01760 [Candidatus Paceibacterota bacterium]|nr:hypothetical protein [Candidatus Paceibacterota bacterium]
MQKLKWLFAGIVAVMACLIFCLPELGVSALLVGLMVKGHQEQVKWQQREPQDRADFERAFQVPAIERADQAGFTDAEYQASQIRRVKIAHVLLVEAQQILYREQELHRLEHTDEGSGYQEQVAQAAIVRKKLDEATTKFATDVRLAKRFDYTGLYDDIDEQFELGHGMDGAFCFVVNRLKDQDLSGFPFTKNLSGPPGCVE